MNSSTGSTKTKFVFVMLQLGYTIITFIPIPLCYSNYYAHTALMWIAFGSSVYNGAVYYIDVFSRRYVGVSKSPRSSAGTNLLDERRGFRSIDHDTDRLTRTTTTTRMRDIFERATT